MKTYKWGQTCPECKNVITSQAFGDDWACSNPECKYYHGYKAAKEKEYIEGYKKWTKDKEFLAFWDKLNHCITVDKRELNKLKDENKKYKDFITDLRMYLYYYHRNTPFQRHILDQIKFYGIKL